jgi:hypothetical protein
MPIAAAIIAMTAVNNVPSIPLYNANISSKVRHINPVIIIDVFMFIAHPLLEYLKSGMSYQEMTGF